MNTVTGESEEPKPYLLAKLHPRQGPSPQPPDEQLLPLSSVLPFVVPDPKKYPQKYAAVYMPVSLAVGRVRTPETLKERSSLLAVEPVAGAEAELLHAFEPPDPAASSGLRRPESAAS